jgi:hypothetical protein
VEHGFDNLMNIVFVNNFSKGNYAIQEDTSYKYFIIEVKGKTKNLTWRCYFLKLILERKRTLRT